MTSLLKPRAKRAESITQPEVDMHHWVARLAVSLSLMADDLPPHLRKHVRKTLDEFCESSACSESLAQHVKEQR